MKLSPLDIYNKEFKKATFGYNTEQVEAFLDEVGMAYEKLLKEVSLLQEENDRLNQRLNSYEELEERMERMLSTVQDSARDYARQARKEAELIIEKAELRAEELKKEARQELENEYRRLQELRESRNFFQIRFRTLLESHLQMLAEAEDQEGEENTLEKEAEPEEGREEYDRYFSYEGEAAVSSEDEYEEGI